MPPRYVYWTIIVDGQPTAFRSGSLEDIMPTFNRLKEKQPTAELKWFQNGQLWPSRHDAQDFMRARGARGRERDPRQSSGDAAGKPAFAKATEGKPERAWNAKPEWKTRTSFSPRGEKPSYAKASADKPEGRPAWKPKSDKPEWKPRSKDAVPGGRPFTGRRDEKPAWSAKGGKPEWKPKGTFKPKEPGHSTGWGEKPAFAKATARQGRSGEKPEWKPQGNPREQARATFRPKSYTPKPDVPGGRPFTGRQSDKPAWKPKGEKLDWKPKAASRDHGPNAGFAKSASGEAPAKRKWVPKAEYKKSLGIEAKRDDKWRPGGEHVDPKQKYKDAKKAKWTRVKATIRARSSKPRKREE